SWKSPAAGTSEFNDREQTQNQANRRHCERFCVCSRSKSEGISMRHAVICEPVRTPIGRYGGMFKSQSAVQLGVTALKGLLERTGLAPEAVQDVILGHCYPNSEAPAIGRVVGLDSGLPVTVPGMQVD